MTLDVLMTPPPGAVAPRYNDRTPAAGEAVPVLPIDVDSLEQAGWVRVAAPAEESEP
jgi:hypothetical protein